jgi:ribosomal protein L7Ae-like RNA K-turn-binding protein
MTPWKGSLSSVKDDILGMLALCRKAGRLKAGFDPAEGALGRDAALIVFAADASPKTKKRMSEKAERAGVPCLALMSTADDIDYVTGKRAVVLAVTDKGFAGAIMKRADAEQQTQAAAFPKL